MSGGSRPEFEVHGPRDAGGGHLPARHARDHAHGRTPRHHVEHDLLDRLSRTRPIRTSPRTRAGRRSTWPCSSCSRPAPDPGPSSKTPGGLLPAGGLFVSGAGSRRRGPAVGSRGPRGRPHKCRVPRVSDPEGRVTRDLDPIVAFDRGSIAGWRRRFRWQRQIKGNGRARVSATFARHSIAIGRALRAVHFCPECHPDHPQPMSLVVGSPASRHPASLCLREPGN